MTLLLPATFSSHSNTALIKADLNKYWSELPGWHLVEHPFLRIEKNYLFSAFADAFEFVNGVTALSEKYDHHPRVVLEWGSVTLEWWTHTVGGVSMNDLICAAQCDECYKELTESSDL